MEFIARAEMDAAVATVESQRAEAEEVASKAMEEARRASAEIGTLRDELLKLQNELATLKSMSQADKSPERSTPGAKQTGSGTPKSTRCDALAEAQEVTPEQLSALVAALGLDPIGGGCESEVQAFAASVATVLARLQVQQDGGSAVGAAGAGSLLAAADPTAIAACRLADGGAALFGLAAAKARQARALEERAAAVQTAAKDIGTFTFGSDQDFKGGLQDMIGLPMGLDEQQWLQHMEAEHCGVDPGDAASTRWGASARPWTTGNYSLETTPQKEWRWVVRREWDQDAAEVPGGFEKVDGGGLREVAKLRRQAVALDALHDDAPARIYAMLEALLKGLGRPLALTVEDLTAAYQKLDLNKAELAGLRLYTGPMFEFYNTALRAKGGAVPWGNRYPMLAGQDTGGRFVTTCHAINSGLLKLSALTPVLSVFRGAAGMKLPARLEVPDRFGGRLGIEYGFMSTTTDKAVAMNYGEDTWSGHGLSHVLEVQMDSLNRGALLQWLSQYPAECEVLFGSLTGLEKLNEAAILPPGGGTIRQLFFRPTTNQRVVLIEELVARRKTMHLASLDNLRLELTGTPPELLDLLDVVREEAAVTDAATYNDDSFYKARVAGAVDLKGMLLRLQAELAEVTGGEPQAAAAPAAVAGSTLFELLGGEAHRTGCVNPGLCAVCALSPALELAPPTFAPGATEAEKRTALFACLEVGERNGILGRAALARAHAVLGPTGEPLGDADWAAACAKCGADPAAGIPLAAAESLWRDQTADRLRHRIARTALLHRLCGSPKVHPAALAAVAVLAEYEPAAAGAALNARRRVLGDGHPATLESVHAVAERKKAAGVYAVAAGLFEEAAAGRQRLLGPTDQTTLVSVAAAGDAWRKAGEHAASEAHLRAGLEARRRVLGDVHEDTLGSISDLASLYRDMERFAEAEPLHLEAVAGRRRVLGGEDPRTLAVMNELGRLYNDMGQYGNAEPLWKEVLAARRRVLGDAHRETLVSINHLALLYHGTRRHAEAEPLYEESLAAKRRVLGADHPETLISLSSLALLYMATGRHAEAEPLYVEALAARRRVLGDAHPETLSSINNLVMLYKRTGRQAEAEPLCEECLAARRRVLGDAHPRTLAFMYNLAGLYEATGRYGEAAALFEEELRGQLGRGDLKEAEPSAGNLLRILKANGMATTALEVLCEAHGCPCKMPL
jgi:tetratricopeptide (TPR) repeat protein